MEMEAAAPLPKKRKSGVAGSSQPEEISSREPPPAAMEAADSHIQQPPPAAEGAEEGADRISGLPDAVLGDIISLLPTREGARTQSLASRWRHLWGSAPLNLDYGDLPAEGDVLIALISRILSAHAGSGRRLRISAHHLCQEPATVDAWLQSPALSNLQELEFCSGGNFPWKLPAAAAAASIFRLSSSLRVATISRCRLPDGISETLHFPQLKQLMLEEVSISEGSLHRFIAGCPVLESMFLNRSSGFNCLRISSPTLRAIGVRLGYPGESHLGEIIIADAPCLERLLLLDLKCILDISIISAPNLEIMGCLSYFYSSLSDFQGSRAVFSTVVHTIKTLSIYVYSNSVDMVLSIISCFPCLEKLYIQDGATADNTPWRRKHKSQIGSLDIRLKTVVLKDYRGVMQDVNFAVFFVLHAKMLELLRFKVRFGFCKDFIARQRRLLQLEKRASRGARFEFTKLIVHRSSILEDIKHVQDLSIADPFE